MPSFYAPHLKENEKEIIITDEEFHHIVNVFRKKENDIITFTNGKGILSEAQILAIEKKKLFAKIKNIQHFSHPKPDIAVAFSLLKQKNDFLIVEKLTELGIREFFPIITERTIKRPPAKIKIKYEKTAISAIKQCDNAYLPKINEPLKLSELISILKNRNFMPFVAYENEKKKTFFDLYKNGDKICLIFGPEGGFSDNEILLFKENNIETFTIGNHILRAETAAISASAIVINSIFEKNRNYY